MKQEVAVTLPQGSYTVHIDRGLLSSCGGLLKDVAPHRKSALIADEQVFAAHGQVLQQSLEKAAYEVYVETFTSGEAHKTIDTVSKLYGGLISHGLERRSPICAFGGGVTGDLVGFVAATYLRGVPLLQIPTTLLAMVDASVGGKVAYNHPLGKNLIGAFYQPNLVLIDTAVLDTLPLRDFRCGLAECIKHGVIGDEELFEWTETNLDSILAKDPAVLIDLVARNVAFKARIVGEDEKEQGIRALLNLGHTFAHAIEATVGYGVLLHGEAVAIGMCAAAKLAATAGRATADCLPRIQDLLIAAGLPTKAPLPETATLLDAMQRDKKVVDGKLRLILPDAIGSCQVVEGVETAAVTDAWEFVRAT